MKNSYHFYEWKKYQCELLKSCERIVRKTDKYLYTEETIEYRRYWYQINFSARRWVCTVYASYEEAERDIPNMAKLFHEDAQKAYITRQEDTYWKCLKHRHNRKG